MSSTKKSMKTLELKGGRMALQQANIQKARNNTALNIAEGKLADREMAIADRTGRLEGLTTIPEWKRQQLLKKQAVNARLVKNGITLKDLADEYNRGKADATKEYVDKLLPYQQKFFYCAAAMASHELFGFGETRILRLLDRVQEIMCEEISTGDIIQRCKAETGIDMFEEEYTI